MHLIRHSLVNTQYFTLVPPVKNIYIPCTHKIRASQRLEAVKQRPRTVGKVCQTNRHQGVH